LYTLTAQAVTSDNPDFRHIVRKDAVMFLEVRNMSDGEFEFWIKKQHLLIELADEFAKDNHVKDLLWRAP
jgi:hypothetical protein